jgi:hypothetical protein
VAVNDVRFELLDDSSQGESGGDQLHDATFLSKRVVLDAVLLEQADILAAIGANGDLHGLLKLPRQHVNGRVHNAATGTGE